MDQSNGREGLGTVARGVSGKGPVDGVVVTEVRLP